MIFFPERELLELRASDFPNLDEEVKVEDPAVLARMLVTTLASSPGGLSNLAPRLELLRVATAAATTPAVTKAMTTQMAIMVRVAGRRPWKRIEGKAKR